MAGALSGLRVVELASESAPYAGKLLADMGAEVVLVEPPGGHPSRKFGPFAGDRDDPESSLWWWHYNTSKKGVVIDLSSHADLFRRLVGTADIVLEAEPPGVLHEKGLDYVDLSPDFPKVIWVSVTPFGRNGPRSKELATDLTIAANAGPAWSSGYDDHSIPPVRPGANQSYHTGAIWAVMGALSGVLYRDSRSGRGQLIDVNLNAASNVTTEGATYWWHVRRETVQRLTGRHAWVTPTTETVTVAADGRAVTTGVLPRFDRQFKILVKWLDDLGLRGEFPDMVFLDMATEIPVLRLDQIGIDPVATAMFDASREGIRLIAQKLPAFEFFQEIQRRGLFGTIVYSPEEVLADPHTIARRFPTEVIHEDLGRTITYPGAPFISATTDYTISRAPHVGEHAATVLGRLGSGVDRTDESEAKDGASPSAEPADSSRDFSTVATRMPRFQEER